MKSKEWLGIFLKCSDKLHELEFLDDIPYSESVWVTLIDVIFDYNIAEMETNCG